MARAKIMVVEDETIVALEIQSILKILGYAVSTVVSSGEEAIRKTAETRPDLVLMDIKLEGDVDGVMAAEQIRVLFGIPVIYLTAYADKDTLQRAKITEPYGYILKPFEKRELHAAIEMALHKYKVEKALRESERKYRTLFEGSKDVVFISTPDGKLVDINSTGVELFGYSSKEELLKIDIARNLYMNPSDWEAYQRMIEQQGFVKDYELVLKRKDGQQVIVVLTANAVRDAPPYPPVDGGERGGTILAYQGIMRDVTEQRRLEQQLFQAQKMASLGVMAGGVAHEINNPLNVISGAAQLLEKRYLDEFAQKSLKVIRDAVSRASRIVHNLLDFARHEPQTSFELLSVNQIVEDALSMFEYQLKLQPIKINKNLADDLPFILGNANQLQQVIMNLILNATSAMLTGGELTLETRSMKNQVVITCSDTGEGISADDLEKIFDPFYTTRAPGEGTGLGLSVSYQIIKQHNGVIEAYSAGKNKGSTFTITLPIYKRNAAIAR
ncbi:response regulator [Candidatus Poribacteria bacterium]|nr:response regulator [Candidatus Poribacteria bacterium]